MSRVRAKQDFRSYPDRIRGPAGQMARPIMVVLQPQTGEFGGVEDQQRRQAIPIIPERVGTAGGG